MLSLGLTQLNAQNPVVQRFITTQDNSQRPINRDRRAITLSSYAPVQIVGNADLRSLQSEAHNSYNYYLSYSY